MADLASAVMRHFAFLVVRYGFGVKRMEDDADGVFVWFGKDAITILVSYEAYSREFYIEFEADIDGRHLKIPLDALLGRAGVTYDEKRPTDRAVIDAQFKELAELVERYAQPALLGDEEALLNIAGP